MLIFQIFLTRNFRILEKVNIFDFEILKKSDFEIFRKKSFVLVEKKSKNKNFKIKIYVL